MAERSRGHSSARQRGAADEPGLVLQAHGKGAPLPERDAVGTRPRPRLWCPASGSRARCGSVGKLSPVDGAGRRYTGGRTRVRPAIRASYSGQLFGPAVGAYQRDEPYGADVTPFQRVPTPRGHGEHLVLTPAQRDENPAAFGELFEERTWHVRRRGADQNGVVRCVLPPSKCPVA